MLNRRRAVLVVTIALLLTVFSGRLIWLQGVGGDAIAAEALQSRLTHAQLVAARGTITDSEGEVLATSVDRYDVVANQQLIKTWSTTEDGETYSGAAGAAQLMAPILGVNAAELGAKLDGDSGYKYVAKNVLPEVWQAIRELRINGITSEQVAERVYPNGNLAGNLLGWVNSEGVGAQGLESTLEDDLAGTPGRTTYERGAGGQLIPGGFEESTAATDGRSVQLTINSDIQWKAQQAIEQQVAATGSASGTIVMTSVKTGEVLAMAESRTVDPNDPGADSTLWGGSSAVSDVFEPGSTAKIITMAAAIETGITDPLQQFEVPYNYTTANGQTFKDSHEHSGQRLTTTGILAESSNTGTVMIGQNLPEQVRHDYLAKFGFGQKTGIELPAEQAGRLWDVDRWDGRTKYAVLFGQGLSVTALQATDVFATIANGGVRVTPHLVKGWTEPDGTFTPAEPAATTQVVSPETAQTVLTMMESAVDEGTGSSAAIPGYRVAGKTGTAQAWAMDGTQGITASFIGVAPADDPEIAVSVVLHNPTTSEWGGVVAAPVFSDVAGYALTELGIAPSGTAPQLFPTEW
ncbi:peptidoglycan D,D-transpeptidase FtsI family protein [Cellulomonas pakistanensis]|uniref:Cell division protein FtsI n=1 Tax=Cellulomonas pakistanensis TaxID=992287 RepID=A0A919U497_9CELL|nr:penicillin-binding protein 2 [Cellulomonas pakistanensis]GIG37241.1 cell division protein FtsI [Cellulomonas pakistanensis]